MAYSINRFSSPASGITVADGATNNTFDITLIGKGFTNYGETIQENILHILENFARNTAPSNPTPGQLWFNLGTGILSVRTAAGAWKSLDDPVGGSITNASIAAGAAIAINKLALGTAAQMIVANLGGTPTYQTITGDIDVSDTGVMSIAANSVGASEIATAGVQTIHMDSSVFITTLTVGVLTASALNLAASAAFTMTGLFTTGTLNVTGDTTLASTDITNLGWTNASAQSGGWTRVSGSAVFNSNVALNGSTYASNFNALSASVSTLVASTFTTTGTAQATYGDLAERYESDETVLASDEGCVVSFGGDNDITISKEFMDTAVAGVVSVYPAYDMNASFQTDHWPRVALAGQVPVRVHGRCRKGDLMVTGEIPGTAIAFREVMGEKYDPRIGSVIGKAKEDKTTEAVELIMVVVGVR